MYPCLNCQIRKEKELFYFFYIHCKKLKASHQIFPLILNSFSFVSNTTNFFIHSFGRFIMTKTTYALLVFFNLEPFSFFVYLNIRFNCL